MTVSVWDIIFFIIGVGGIILGLWSLRKALYLWSGSRRAENWPSTVGEIISFKLGREYRASGFDNTPGYGAQVHYKYQVSGTEYEGNTLYYGDKLLDGYLSEMDARNRRSRYTPGAAVHVHYNPRDPQESVLEHNLLREHAIPEFFLGGLSLIIIGGWALWRAIAAVLNIGQGAV